MARISTKPVDDFVTGSDRVLGTDANDSNKTKNYTIDSLATYMGAFAAGYPTLEQVASSGAITQANITTQGFTSTGTRDTPDLKVIIGDYDASGNDTKLTIDDINGLSTFNSGLNINGRLGIAQGAFMTNLLAPSLSGIHTANLQDASGTLAFLEDLAGETVEDIGGTIVLDTTQGRNCNFGSANSNTAYSITSTNVINAWSQVLINTITEPSVTHGSKTVVQVGGISWIARTDMYLYVRDIDANTIHYAYSLKAVTDGGSNILAADETTGLQVNIATFVININENDIIIPASSVTLFANETKFIGIDLVDYSVHSLLRDYQDGMIWLGKVTTGAANIISIENYEPKLPVEKIPNFKHRLNAANTQVKTAILFDSLGGVVGGGNSWEDMLFDVSLASYGYNVPNVLMAYDVDNYHSGGQTSHYGSLWTAKASKSNAGAFNNTTLSFDNVAQGQYDAYTDFKVLRDSPLFTKKYDLVIIGFGANGGTEKFAWLENTVKLIREAKIDVIISTENHRSAGGETTNTSMYADGETLKRIALHYGCALADTWSFVKEISVNGETTLYDTVHPNERGREGYADSFRTIINSAILPTVGNAVSEQRIIKGLDHPYQSKNFPNYTEIDCHYYSTTGSLVASTGDDFCNPAVQFAGIDPASSVIELAVGQEVRFSPWICQCF